VLANCFVEILICIQLDDEPKVIQNPTKQTTSPKIVINKKNFVFGEAIHQLNKDKNVTKKHLPIRKARSTADVGKVAPKTLHQGRIQAEVPSFNPFEISSQTQTRRFKPINKAHEIRSNSDVHANNGFLSRVETFSDSKQGRRSDVVPHDNPFSSTFKNLYTEFNKLNTGPDSNSNIESSNENSMLSNEVMSHGMPPFDSRKSIMMYKPQDSPIDSASKYTDELYNPFAVMTTNHIVEETDEE
jgi:hypothetical protein